MPMANPVEVSLRRAVMARGTPMREKTKQAQANEARFAALTLAEAGAKPIVLERGLAVEERCAKIDTFNRFGVLDTECNAQFGEGGAGTYSDGKLKAGARDKYKMKVLNEFVLAGADESITYSTAAHLGTDKLPAIVKAIREKIISLGGAYSCCKSFETYRSALVILDYSFKHSAVDVIKSEIVYFKCG